MAQTDTPREPDADVAGAVPAASHGTAPEPTPDRPTWRSGRGIRAELVVLGGELVLVAAASALGIWATKHGVPIHASAAPLFARWLPHVGPGTVPALAVAALVVAGGPRYAATARWGPLLVMAYVAAFVWTLALALVDGWQRGVAGRLTTTPEYLHDVGRVTSVRTMLETFTAHLVGTDGWTTHVSGHPPGAFLVFVVLDRVGLGGGGPAAIFCITVGALAPVCVAVALRALGAEPAARVALPFLVLFPGGVWVGVSADGMFMGVAAAGLALLTLPGMWRPLLGGALLGFSLYLSYGLVLLAPLILVVLAARPRLRVGAGATSLFGAVAVAVMFTAAGFWWLDGYRLTKIRYYQEWGAERPYWYWVWADVACLVVSAGPAFGPALLRAVGAAWRSLRSRPLGRVFDAVRIEVPAWVAVAAAAGVLAADLSGLSKGEVERIWLPYAMWLSAAAVLLPAGRRRAWLALQAATALLVNHFLLTHW